MLKKALSLFLAITVAATCTFVPLEISYAGEDSTLTTTISEDENSNAADLDNGDAGDVEETKPIKVDPNLTKAKAQYKKGKAFRSKRPTIKAKAVSYNKVKVSWSKVKGATGYELYKYKKGKGYVKIGTYSSKTRHKTVKGLSKKHTYYFKVRAIYKTSVSAKNYPKKTFKSKYSKSNKARTPAAVNGVSLAKPVSKLNVCSSYGWRWGAMHLGVDLARPYGSNIYAATDGTVVFATWQSTYGLVIKIKGAKGVKTIYAHCSRVLVKPGQKVKRGDVIGKVGSTGNASCNHCHFEIRVYGYPVNPMNYL